MAGIPFIVMIVLIFVLYQIAKKKDYIKEVEDVSKDEYGLKDFIPIGLALNHIIGEKNINKLNKSSQEKIIRIYGNNSKEKFRVYTGNKAVISLLFMTAIYFFQAANGSFSIALTLGGVVAFIGAYFLTDTTLDQMIEKRNQNIKYDFPEFLSKLTLLISAGLTFESAWEKVLNSTNKNSVLYHEFKKTFQDMEANITREVCLKNLSRRCKVNEISKFSTIVLQNITKGSADMTNKLEMLANECWVERKSLAKKKGEEASTKLLFPMMLMLLAVFIITVVPALMQMFNL